MGEYGLHVERGDSGGVAVGRNGVKLPHPNQEDLLGWEEWQRSIDPYCQARIQVDSWFERRLHLYMAIFPLWWMSIVISRGRSQPEKLPAWSVNKLPINDRLRRYLARVVAWPEMDYEKALRQIETINFFSV